jgi:hypothetical protein
MVRKSLSAFSASKPATTHFDREFGTGWCDGNRGVVMNASRVQMKWGDVNEKKIQTHEVWLCCSHPTPCKPVEDTCCQAGLT